MRTYGPDIWELQNTMSDNNKANISTTQTAHVGYEHMKPNRFVRDAELSTFNKPLHHGPQLIFITNL